MHHDVVVRKMSAEIRAELQGKRLVPEHERAMMLTERHGLGHMGGRRMCLQLFHDGFYWPNMIKDCEQEVAQCVECVRFNVVREGFHPSREIAAALPNDLWLVDLSVSMKKASSGETVMLVVVDVFTGYIWLRALKKKEKELVAEALYKIMVDAGVPRAIQMDNGKEFINNVIETFCIKQRPVAADDHHANGQVERAIRSATTIMKKEVNGALNDWVRWVPVTQIALNMGISSATGSSAFSLYFGRSFMSAGRERYDITDEQERAAWVEKQRWLLEVIYPAVVERKKGVHAKGNAHSDKKKKIVEDELVPGTVVFAKDPRREQKWDAVYEGPYEVVGKDETGGYVLKGDEGLISGRSFAVRYLKLVHPSHIKGKSFIVEKILAHRKEGPGFAYLVKFKGYDEEYNEWLPAANFNDLKIIATYWKSLKG